MFRENFHQTLVALLADNGELRNRSCIPMGKVRLQNFNKGIMAELICVCSEDIKVVVLVATCLLLLYRFLPAHFRQHMMMNDLLVPNWNVTFVMSFDDSGRVEFVDEEKVLLAWFAQKWNRPKHVIFREDLLIALICVRFIGIQAVCLLTTSKNTLLRLTNCTARKLKLVLLILR